MTRPPDNQSASSSSKRPAPAPPNHDRAPSHVIDAAAAAAGRSRSSSRSSGFDENSSTVTDCSVLPPISVAHAHDDGPEVTSSSAAAEDVGGEAAALAVDSSAESGTTTRREDDDDADIADTLRVTPAADLRESADDENAATGCENPPPGGDARPGGERCSSQATAADDDARRDAILEEQSRQIESMLERFNTMYDRVKAAKLAELTSSTSSLRDSRETLPHRRPNAFVSADDVRPRPPSVAAAADVAKYSRNSAYRRWISARAGALPEPEATGTRQPITAAADAVDTTTDDAPAGHVTPSSAPIGQRADDAADGVRSNAASTELDDVIDPAYAADVTSATHELRSPKVNSTHTGGTGSRGVVPNWSEAGADKTQTVTSLRIEVCSDLGTTLKPAIYEGEPSVPADRSSLVQIAPRHRRACSPDAAVGPAGTQMSRPVDDTNAGDDDETSSSSGHPSRYSPGSTSAQPEDVFTDVTPTRSVGAASGVSRRILPSIPARRPSSTQPAADVFLDDRTSCSSSSPTHRQMISASVSSSRRLRPAGSYDSLPRIPPIRRRSAFHKPAHTHTERRTSPTPPPDTCMQSRTHTHRHAHTLAGLTGLCPGGSAAEWLVSK